MAGNISMAYNLIVQACNDPNIGYSASSLRTTITLGSSSRTYCDCSSLISWALTMAGFFNQNPWFTTATEANILEQAGFQRLPVTVEQKAGDILWCNEYPYNGRLRSHTEMVYKPFSGLNAYTMGAHTDSYPFDQQVSINTGLTLSTGYQAIFRFGGGGVTSVTNWFQTPMNQPRHLTPEETLNNAACLYNELLTIGCTLNSAAAIIANSEYESAGINPNCWEGFVPFRGGYGLFQFTPYSKYHNWAQAEGIDLGDANANGNGQVRCLDTLPGEWIPTSKFPLSWAQFKMSNESPEYLAEAFLRNYERPADPEASLEQRKARAKYWYATLPGLHVDFGHPSAQSHPFIPGIIADLTRRKIILK